MNYNIHNSQKRFFEKVVNQSDVKCIMKNY